MAFGIKETLNFLKGSHHLSNQDVELERKFLGLCYSPVNGNMGELDQRLNLARMPKVLVAGGIILEANHLARLGKIPVALNYDGVEFFRTWKKGLNEGEQIETLQNLESRKILLVEADLFDVEDLFSCPIFDEALMTHMFEELFMYSQRSGRVLDDRFITAIRSVMKVVKRGGKLSIIDNWRQAIKQSLDSNGFCYTEAPIDAIDPRVNTEHKDIERQYTEFTITKD